MRVPVQDILIRAVLAAIAFGVAALGYALL